MPAKSALFCLVLLFLWLGGGLSSALEPGELSSGEIGQLSTQDGRQFFDVRIQGTDPTGLYFQHRHGSAKILFSNLDPAVGKAFGYREEEAEAFERGKPRTEIDAGMPAWADPIDVSQALPPLTLTFRTRTILPVRGWYPSGGCGYSPTGCGASLASYPWPSHWSRFHPGLAYSLFPCRQLAERDFLITSGILPRPPGVCTWRLR